MKCAPCLLTLGKKEPTTLEVAKVAEEVTRIQGTALCAKHAMVKMGQITIQAEMGLVTATGGLTT